MKPSGRPAEPVDPAAPFDPAGHPRVARALGYLLEGKGIEAAHEIVEISTEFGLDELQGSAIAELNRTRRVERELLEGTIPRSEAEATRTSSDRNLHRLIREAAKEARQRDAARSAPSPVAAQPRRGLLGARPPEPSAGAMVECQEVIKRYGPRFVLGPVSFTLAYGEILAVVGANASGKSSLLRIVAGELAPDGGARTISSRDAGERPLDVPVMSVPESPPPWSDRMAHYLSWQAAIFGYRAPHENDRQVERALGQLDIAEHRHKRWAELSDGIRMRTALAAAMIGNPGVLVLDEPLSPLDPQSQQALLRLMRVYAHGERRMSFVISTHHVTEVEVVADWVLPLQPGAPCAPVRPESMAGSRGTHFRLDLEPGADRAEVVARLKELGMEPLELPSFILVHVTDEAGLALTELAERLSGTGLRSIQDLTRSNLRPLLWGKRP